MMLSSNTQEITELLRAWSDGDENALEELTPIIYAELHRIAKHYMGHERKDHILQTTALVNEAYMRLIDWENAKWNNRAHFFGVSAQLMRRILIDFARKLPKVDNVEVQQISLAEVKEISVERDVDVVELHDALTELEKFDERKAKIVELKFFGGLKVEEIAELLDISPTTIWREWNTAKAWLYQELSK